MSKPTIQEGIEQAKTHEVAYYYDDEALGVKYPVYKGLNNAFWIKDNGTQMLVLLNRFKIGDTIKQACYIAKVSYDQFRYFALVHPWVYPVIRTYKELVPHRLKAIILAAALGGQDMVCTVCKGKGYIGKTKEKESKCIACQGKGMVKTPPNAAMALGAIHLPTLADKEREPELMDGIEEASHLPRPHEGEAVISEEAKAFDDGNGQILVSRKTLARLNKLHGTSNTTTGTAQ